MRQTAPTPKVFNAKYSPPKTSTNGSKVPRRPLIIVVLIIVGGFLLTRLPLFRIQSVELNGSLSPDAKKISESLVGESIFSTKISRTSNQIVKTNQDIARFDCTRGLPSSLRCNVILREARFVWRSSGKDYLLDQTGYIFAQASKELTVLEDRANKPIAVGEYATSEDIVASYVAIVGKLKDSGIVVSQLFITESFYQFGAILSGRTSPDQPFPAGPVTTLFTTSYSTDAQVKILMQLLKERSPLIKERIDLRAVGNVYYY